MRVGVDVRVGVVVWLCAWVLDDELSEDGLSARADTDSVGCVVVVSRCPLSRV